MDDLLFQCKVDTGASMKTLVQLVVLTSGGSNLCLGGIGSNDGTVTRIGRDNKWIVSQCLISSVVHDETEVTMGAASESSGNECGIVF